jgi:hypothetical protein
MNKLLKDAIADAKAVRETALANAKVALEEAFAPKLQSMLSHKIKEEMDEEPIEEPSEDGKMEVAKMQKMAGITNEEEIEVERPESDERSWGKKNFAGKPDDVDEEKEEDWADDSDSDTEEDWSGEDDWSDEDGSEKHHHEKEGDEEGDEKHHHDEEGDEEVSDEELDEILKELDMEDETVDPNAEKYNADQNMQESEDPEHVEEEEKEEMDEEINLDEIIKALKEEEGDEEEEKESAKTEAVKAELNEAYTVIKFLRGKLNEVNLLNAKLLFVNKLFKKANLSESQKIKIIETFDRAKNVRETKLIYATLSESINGGKVIAPKKVKKINEGLASAPSKSTKTVITEGNNVYNRFKSLVNYNKH